MTVDSWLNGRCVGCGERVQASMCSECGTTQGLEWETEAQWTHRAAFGLLAAGLLVTGAGIGLASGGSTSGMVLGGMLGASGAAMAVGTAVASARAPTEHIGVASNGLAAVRLRRQGAVTVGMMGGRLLAHPVKVLPGFEVVREGEIQAAGKLLRDRGLPEQLIRPEWAAPELWHKSAKERPLWGEVLLRAALVAAEDQPVQLIEPVYWSEGATLEPPSLLTGASVVITSDRWAGQLDEWVLRPGLAEAEPGARRPMEFWEEWTVADPDTVSRLIAVALGLGKYVVPPV